MLRTLARGASVAFLLQVSGVGLTYTLQILLARWMGVHEYGIYDYVMSWGTFLAFLAGLGLPNAVLRFVAEYSAQGHWGYVRGVMHSSFWQTLGSSALMALLGTAIFWGVTKIWPISYEAAVYLGLWAIPILAVMKLQLETVRAMGQIALAYAPSLLLWPLVFIVSGFLYAQTHDTFTSETAIALTMVSLGVLLVGQNLQFRYTLATKIADVQPQYAIRQWLQAALPLLLIDSSFVILNQTDVLMIGMMLSPEQVGLYSAAIRTSQWVSFMLVAVNAIAAPMFAALYAQGDREGLQRLVSTIAHWIFWPALGVLVGLATVGDSILHWFGNDFVQAQPEMIVLGLGQLVNVGAGSVGYLLLMTGHHRQCAYVVGASALLNLLLNLIGIPTLGILGAAIATAITMTLWNIGLNLLVVRQVGVQPSILFAIAPSRLA